MGSCYQERFLYFDLGSVKENVYGTAMDLKGEIKLLCGNRYKIPTLCLNRVKLNTIGKEMAEKYQPILWPDKSPEQIQPRAMIALIIALYQNPEDDWDTNELIRHSFEFSLSGYAVDDIIDNMSESISQFIGGYRMIQKLTKDQHCIAFDKSGEGLSKFCRKLPFGGESFYMFYKTFQNMRDHIPNFDENIKYFREDLFNSYISNYLVLSGRNNSERRFSHMTFTKYLTQHAHGMRLNLELNALEMLTARFPEEIRQDLVFQTMKSALGNAAALLNAILGLRKDIRDNTWFDTPILSNVVTLEKNLQNEFNFCLEDLKGEINDMKLCIDILNETYPDDDGLLDYIKVLKYTFDGTCYAYADPHCSTRYGNNIVEIRSQSSFD